MLFHKCGSSQNYVTDTESDAEERTQTAAPQPQKLTESCLPSRPWRQQALSALSCLVGFAHLNIFQSGLCTNQDFGRAGAGAGHQFLDMC